MRRNSMVITLYVLAAVLALTAACGGMKQASGPEPQTEDQKTLYALGLVISENLKGFTLSESDFDHVVSGMKDGVLKRDRKVKLEEYGPKIEGLARTRMEAGAQAEKTAGGEFLDKAAGASGAVRTPSGIVYTETQAGSGPAPRPTDKVRVHYRGTLTDGTEFDSSYKRNEPVVFPLTGVIPCWTEGLQLMKTGGKATLVCPPNLAYGDQGRPPAIKPGATLVFEIELIGIEP